MRATTTKKSTPQRKPATPRLDLLLLECNTAKLEADGLAVADATAVGLKVVDWLSQLNGSAPIKIEVLKANTRADLLSGLARIKETYSSARAILICGHSNSSGIKLAADCFAEWPVAAAYLAPFQPSHVALLACMAGGRDAVSRLASALPGVREIVASPATATRSLVLYLAGWLLSKVRRRRFAPDSKLLGQVALAILGQNVAFHWTRGELRETAFDSVLTGALLEAGAKALVQALRQGARPPP